MVTPFPKIETKNLQLNHIGEDDLENIYRGLSHPQVIKYYGVNYDSLEKTKGQLQWYADLEKNKNGIWWSITDQTSQQFQGAIGFSDYDRKENRAELGFWLLPEFWGKGIMQEAIKRVLDYGFKELHLTKIEAFVETDNSNSKKLLEKMGFKLEQTRENCELKGDSYISLDIYFIKFKDE